VAHGKAKEAAHQGLTCKSTIGKDCTEATSAKPARLPSRISQSGREGIENERSSARKEDTEQLALNTIVILL